MHRNDLTEVDLTLRQIATRDRDTDEESTAWEVSHENLDGVVRADSASEALELFAECLEAEDEETRIDIDELETESQPLA